MPEDNNIQEWVKAAKAGEETAWNVLYQRYYPGLFAIALQICGNISETKDIVQNSFVTAWLKLSQLKDSANFGGWIKTIVARNCYHYLHKNGQRKNSDSISIRDEHSLRDELETRHDSLLTQSRLYTALTRLPEVLRTTLLLRYFSSYQSYSDIAEILSIPVGTVRSRLNEAKLKLAEKWNQPTDYDQRILKERDEWNSFYLENYSGLHRHYDCKKRFFNHLDKNMQITFPGGKPDTGSRLFENVIADDLRVGSWLTPINVLSCGNISIIESKHFNSAEHPGHCPPRSVTMLFRKKTEAYKMNLYFSLQ